MNQRSITYYSEKFGPIRINRRKVGQFLHHIFLANQREACRKPYLETDVILPNRRPFMFILRVTTSWKS